VVAGHAQCSVVLQVSGIELDAAVATGIA
jgi:hypothetical protein